MTVLTLEITTDLESQLRREAAKVGLDPSGYVLSTLRERLGSHRASSAPRLAANEAKLLQQINQGLPAQSWKHYGELKEKRRSEKLTAAEQAELIALSDQIEEMNVRRMKSVIQLAQLRQTSVDALMSDLGIKSPMYE